MAALLACRLHNAEAMKLFMGRPLMKLSYLLGITFAVGACSDAQFVESEPSSEKNIDSVYERTCPVSDGGLNLSCGTSVGGSGIPVVPIAQIPFADLELKRCVTDNVNQWNSWQTPIIQYSNQVTDLWCGGGYGEPYDIKKLNGIEYLTSLQNLTVGNLIDSNQKLNLSPLSSLKKISWVSFRGPRIQDLVPLGASFSLRGLNLNQTNVPNLDALANLQLESIGLVESPMPYSLSALAQMPSLVAAQVSIRGNSSYQLQLANVLRLPNLKYLNIDNDGSAYGSLIIQGMEQATQLENLYIGMDVPIAPTQLSGLTNLKSLSFQGSSINRIYSLSGLETLTNLESLSIQGNWVQDISALSGLVKMKWLNLGSNSITNISALANMTALETVTLDYNQITDISALGNKPNLTVVNLEWNRQLPSISALLSLPRLQFVSTYFDDLIPCSQISQLEAQIASIGGGNFIHSNVCVP
jgi:Leucine-rich repeat (LRR) protein